MVSRQVVHPPPHEEPQKSQKPWNHECRTPAPVQVDRNNSKRRNDPSDGRATVKKGTGQRAIAFRKPLRNGFGCARPVRGFAHAKKEAEACKAIKAPGE